VRPADEPPRFTGILETVLYVAALGRAERFYRDVMGRTQIGKEPGRHVFFRVGSGVLLLFRAQTTRQAGNLPPHGADGEIHVCFTTSPPSTSGGSRASRSTASLSSRRPTNC